MTVSMKEEMQKVAFMNYAGQFGLKPEWLGKTFKDDKGRTFTVVGLNINSKKFPVVTKEGVSFNADYFKMLMTGDQTAYEQGLEEKLQKRLQETRQTYLKFGESYGLKKEWLDKTFAEGRYQYTIVGLAFGRTRTKVVTRRNDGRVFDWPANAIANKLKAAA